MARPTSNNAMARRSPSETLAALGAKVRRRSCNIVFACNGETQHEYWWRTEQMMIVLGENSCVRPVDDGKGMNQETTIGVHRLREIADKYELLFPAINVKDCVTMAEFNTVFGCRHFLSYSIIRTSDVDGKRILVHGHGDVGRGSAFELRDVSDHVRVIEIDPIIALQACLEDFQVVTIEDFIHEIDIFTSATGNSEIIAPEHMKKIKNSSIV
ncbi:unnamed protein product [Polarella glacialis]|uniref:S-adenosyl-L-homocysteine hydrolase NAD binding domain-containing protein n=1 Tax=Polarella glacialis TaxID=89957 RepID=A0A813F4J4_POLGL|nr:unnamed protein product [Polarella glacialis]CAE8681961.1 unnamed protein product [Polarella glacialis]